MRHLRTGLFTGAGLLVMSACFNDWDRVDPSQGTPPSAGGSTGDGGTGGEGASGGSGGASGTCTPGEQIPCYTGDEGTENVGACVGGTTTCNDEGTAFGACEGEVTPVAELCGTAADDDCDGEVNEVDAGCSCTPGELSACYDGPMNTEDIGLCVGGTKVCEASGNSESVCAGQVLPRHEECVTAGDDDCDGATNEGCPTKNGIRFGAFEDDTSLPWAVAIDGADGYAIGGEVLASSINFGGGARTTLGMLDGFVARFDAADAHQWSVRFGGANDDAVHDLAMDTTGNVYITGYFGGALTIAGCATVNSTGGRDTFIAKLDSATGSCAWLTHLAGDTADQTGWGIAVSTDGAEVVATGSYDGTIDVGNGAEATATPGEADGFIVSLNGTTGAINWGQRFGGNNDDGGLSVALDGSDIIVGGFFDELVAFGTGTPIADVTAQDGFVAKLDGTNDGEQTWIRRVGSNGNAYVRHVAVDSVGDVVINGIFNGDVDFGAGATSSVAGNDFFVAKFSSAGTLAWERAYGGTDDQNEGPLAIDSTNAIWFGVSHEDTADYGDDILFSAGNDDWAIVKLDASGNTIRSLRFGNSSDQDPRSIAVRSDDSVIVVGEVVGTLTLDIGLPALTGNSEESILIAFLPP